MSAAPTPPELPVQRARVPPRAAGRRHRRIGWAVLAGVAAAGLPSPVVASSGGGRRITDTANTRTVYLVVAALILLAIGLAVFTWWFWRATRRDHDSLAPLEVMADRKFLAADAIARQVMLDQSRPIGAAPLAPGAIEPLLLPAAPDAADVGEEVPVPTVVATEIAPEGETADLTEAAVAAVAVEPEAVTTRTGPPAASVADGDATTLIELPTSADDEHEAQPSDLADTEAADLAEAMAADAELEQAADAQADRSDVASTASGAASADEVEVDVEREMDVPTGTEGEVQAAGVHVLAGRDARNDEPTMAIETVPATPARVAAPMPTVRPAFAPAAPPADEAASRAVNGATSAAHPIDPGLPHSPTEVEPPRHLSLAELAALGADRPLSFDENELTSTPSTGIPVVESAEAWVERQLAERRPTANGSGGTSHPADADADDR